VVGHTHPEVQYLPPRIRLQLSSSGSTVATISHVAYNVISIGTTLLTAIAQLLRSMYIVEMRSVRRRR
jgi:hypothetical protein